MNTGMNKGLIFPNFITFSVLALALLFTVSYEVLTDAISEFHHIHSVLDRTHVAPCKNSAFAVKKDKAKLFTVMLVLFDNKRRQLCIQNSCTHDTHYSVRLST